jgi:leucine dehydrogenase
MIQKTHLLGPNHELHVFIDESVNFYAAICLNLQTWGVALGGVRLASYGSPEDADLDVINITRAMSDKARFCQIPFDGGNAVILKPEGFFDRHLILSKFAECVNHFDGRFIATIDIGTTAEDMSFLKTLTPYVTGDTLSEDQFGSTVKATAFGVFQGMSAAVKALFDDHIQNKHVIIQGLGKVGHALCYELVNVHASVSLSDNHPEQLVDCAALPRVQLLEPSVIYKSPCDIFAPCALGNVINAFTVPQLQAKIIAGSANNQLADDLIAEELMERGIFYIPDFILNVGGMIHLAMQFSHPQDRNIVHTEISKIYDRVFQLCLEMKESNRSGLSIARDRLKNMG